MQSFLFMAFSLTGTKVGTTKVQRSLSKRCPCSVFHDRVYGTFRNPLFI